MFTCWVKLLFRDDQDALPCSDEYYTVAEIDRSVVELILASCGGAPKKLGLIRIQFEFVDGAPLNSNWIEKKTIARARVLVVVRVCLRVRVLDEAEFLALSVTVMGPCPCPCLCPCSWRGRVPGRNRDRDGYVSEPVTESQERNHARFKCWRGPNWAKPARDLRAKPESRAKSEKERGGVWGEG